MDITQEKLKSLKLNMKEYIAQNFGESDWKEFGVVTGTYERIRKHPRLLRSLGWGDSDYQGCIIDILEDMNEETLLKAQSFLTKKEDFVLTNISSPNSKISPKVSISPKVFDIPDKQLDHKLVSVMMPFKTELTSVYEAIQDASSNAQLVCKRGDDIWENSVIIQDVFSLIYQSNIVICDFSGKNTNVFYEAGIAHTLGKEVIPITQSADDIPFDLRHHRFITYLNNKEGLQELKKSLIEKFKIIKKEQGIKEYDDVPF